MDLFKNTEISTSAKDRKERKHKPKKQRMKKNPMNEPTKPPSEAARNDAAIRAIKPGEMAKRVAISIIQIDHSWEDFETDDPEGFQGYFNEIAAIVEFAFNKALEPERQRAKNLWEAAKEARDCSAWGWHREKDWRKLQSAIADFEDQKVDREVEKAMSNDAVRKVSTMTED